MTPEYYRNEARRARRLAADLTDLVTAQRLRAVAADYDKLARELERPLASADLQARIMDATKLEAPLGITGGSGAGICLMLARLRA